VEAQAERTTAATRRPRRAEAERGVALMEEISSGLRGCAILGPRGGTLASSGKRKVWGEAAAGFLEVADAARPGSRVDHVHVGTEDGEVFAVRHGGLTMVAVTERFTLSSLVISDMRAILRDLAAGEVIDRRAPERGVAPEDVEAEAAAPPVD
jgi:hypothetical protein